MKLRKVVKKIVALGVGATMLGATLGSVMAAADLANYPSPFIKDGKFSGVLVIGDKADAKDIIGVSDIAVGLQYAATKKAGTTTGSGTTVTGDVFRLGSTNLQITEPISTEVSVVDSDDIKALAGGSLANNKGTYTYEQLIIPGNSSVEFVVSDETGVTEDPKLYLKAKQDGDLNTKADGSELLRYKLSFPSALKSDIDSSRDLDDLDNKKITILGKEYTFTDTDFNLVGPGKITLTMMGGAAQDTLEEGETKTFTIGGVEYEVTATIITDSAPYKAKFLINSETTDALQEGETYTLADKTQLGIKEILPTEAGDVTNDLVSFYLGAKKLELQDTSLAANATGYAGKLTIGSNVISNAYVDITGTNTSTEVSISTIELSWQLDDNYYVPEGGKLTEHLTDQDDIDLAEAFNLDLQYLGVDNQGELDVVEIKPSGSSNLRLKMKTKSGQEISEEVLWTDATSIKLGKDGDKILAVDENSFINKDDYFVTEANGYSHIFQLKKIDTTNTEIELRDVAGESITQTYSSGAATVYVDGYAITFSDIAAAGINLTGIAYDSGDTKADLNTKNGHRIRLQNTSAFGIFNISEAPGANREDTTTAKDVIIVNATIGTGSKITPNVILTTSPINGNLLSCANISLCGKDPTLSLDTNDNKKEGMTKWGTFIEQDTSGDQDSLTLTIPEKETAVKVYLTAGVTTTSEGVAGTVDSVTIQKIEVGATKLASEVSDIKAQNAIIVGGPCANAAAKTVMGNPADCAAGFEEGKGMIKLYEHANGNVAMVVAGYSADDTRTTCQVVANYKEHAGKLTGTAVEVTTATSTVTELVETVAEE